MKAAVFYGKGDIRYEEREVKEPGFKEVMIHVKAAGICGTDMHTMRVPKVPQNASRRWFWGTNLQERSARWAKGLPE